VAAMQPPLVSERGKSLNLNVRKNENDRIVKENQALAKRLFSQ
jgi:hypothetical protein